MFWRKKDKKEKENRKIQDDEPTREIRVDPDSTEFHEFDELFDNLTRLTEEMFKTVMDPNSGFTTYTRRVTMGPDGKPRVEEFVNGTPVGQVLQEGDAEVPDVEVVESGDKVIATVEVQGSSKEQVKATLKNNVKLIVETKGGRTEVNLPGPVEPLSAKLNNGVLVCTFKKNYSNSEQVIKVE
ncbi:Hsp20/alpha crystallin family protein [Metallosphaera tengchongensis]|uniref:Hsp20/alpha crystallin family protein n=1 Tax=Metallosphaera tengchongensis TaxID=1532350 RepID=A0A6N0NZS9_9CREN|nr:Hsp20/alpha crystallin family protein [Metallosphaera tengchongensis]QKR00641.1 Hsp20/alpha crystallin family protein [Metallosphaera tengchongensis]